MAIFILMNNFFHDFTAAFWVASTLLVWYLSKEVSRYHNKDIKKFYNKIFPVLMKATWVSLIANFILGVFRAINYYNFEYLPAAGKNQVVILIIKHVLILLAVGFALLLQMRLWKGYQSVRRPNTSG